MNVRMMGQVNNKEGSRFLVLRQEENNSDDEGNGYASSVQYSEESDDEDELEDNADDQDIKVFFPETRHSMF